MNIWTEKILFCLFQLGLGWVRTILSNFYLTYASKPRNVELGESAKIAPKLAWVGPKIVPEVLKSKKTPNSLPYFPQNLNLALSLGLKKFISGLSNKAVLGSAKDKLEDMDVSLIFCHCP